MTPRTNDTDKMREARRLAEAYGLDCAAMKGREESPYALKKLETLLAHIRTMEAGAQKMTRAEVDEVVYACRQAGDDSTYAIVNAAIARQAAASLARAAGVQEVGRSPDSYVQNVPSQCDRILWRGVYYILPLATTRSKVVAPLPTMAHAQLMKFYGVDSLDALIAAQAGHVEKLQAKLPQSPNVFAPQRVREG